MATRGSYQPETGSAKSLTLEAWGPGVVEPWGNCFSAVLPPRVVLPDPNGAHRAPPDVIVNGRAEFNRAGREPVLEPGDVVSNPAAETVFRVPTELVPAWELPRAPVDPRADVLGLLERQARLAGIDLSEPQPGNLLGAARAWRLGALRCAWNGGFVTAAHWAPAATVRPSLAWHLWQLLASPAGVGLEVFRGAPVDAEDLEATLDVIARFPAPRLRAVTLETSERIECEQVAGVEVRRAALPWLQLAVNGALPEHVALEGPTNRPVVRWRQLVEVRVNGQTPDDRCLWHEGLWVELRGGDVVSWPGGEVRVHAGGAV